MMQNVNTNELLEQLNVLHTNVAQIAEQMSGLHATKKGIDKKASVIGRALVEQKQTTEQVLQNQSNLNEVLEQQMSDSKEDQKRLQNMIQTLIRDVNRFRNTEEREDTILKSLNRLSVEQARYMTENQSLHKKASSDLATVYDILDKLKQTLNQMDIGDQVEFMSQSMERLQELLQQYAETRIQLETKLLDRMDQTEKQVRLLTEKLSEQSKKIEAVVHIAAAYEEKTTKMCETFDEFLSNRPTEMSIEQTSLEELFAEKSEEEAPSDDDVPCEDNTSNRDEEPRMEEVPETRPTEEEASYFYDEDDPDDENAYDEDDPDDENDYDEDDSDDANDYDEDEIDDAYEDEAPVQPVTTGKVRSHKSKTKNFESVAIEDDPDIQVIGLNETDEEPESEERNGSRKKKKGFFARMFGR